MPEVRQDSDEESLKKTLLEIAITWRCHCKGSDKIQQSTTIYSVSVAPGGCGGCEEYCYCEPAQAYTAVECAFCKTSHKLNLS